MRAAARNGDSGHSKNRILVVTLDAYRFSTRSRKAAIRYSSLASTSYLGLAGVGRTGRWDKPGKFVADGVAVEQIPVRRPWLAPTRSSQVRNLFLSYLPAFVRMARAVIRVPAGVIHVTGIPLALLGVIHRARFGSTIILDITERPGVVTASGSLASVFSRVEPKLLGWISRHVDVATVVTEGDLETVTNLGFQRVFLVRNAPCASWRAPYTPPPTVAGGGLLGVVIGTIFEGRGYELLLRALAKVRNERDVRLAVYGPGREEYLAKLNRLTVELGIADRVSWMGRIDSGDVSAAYLAAQVGVVLYETSDLGNDGLSNKILECVSTGRPVIAGDLPENRSFVATNGVGWLVDVGVDAIAQALLEVGAHDDIPELSARCRRYGDTWLNWESEFAEVLAVVSQRQASEVQSRTG